MNLKYIANFFKIFAKAVDFRHTGQKARVCIRLSAIILYFLFPANCIVAKVENNEERLILKAIRSQPNLLNTLQL